LRFEDFHVFQVPEAKRFCWQKFFNHKYAKYILQLVATKRVKKTKLTNKWPKSFNIFVNQIYGPSLLISYVSHKSWSKWSVLADHGSQAAGQTFPDFLNILVDTTTLFLPLCQDPHQNPFLFSNM
jgi:hypothetical protein